MTTEGWIGISHSGVDAIGIDKNPQYENNYVWAYFFIMFVIFGSMFLLNMLVSVVIDNFHLEKNMQLGDAFLTEA